MALRSGDRVGPYEIERPLGAGGMGEVYRARDTRLGRAVAVKVLPSELARHPDRLARFAREARATAAIDHPNLIVVHDVGESAESPYLVLELLDGETLRERLARDARLPAPKALDLARQLVAGLAAAHEKGVAHRDLKPENLFITRDGRLKILDFGLAAAAGELPSPEAPTLGGTEAGIVLGTPGYFAPEQARGMRADARSDLFAVGAILFEMLTGARAFAGETIADLVSSTLVADPLEGHSELAPPIARVLRRCLEKRPEERFRSAHDLGFALEAVAPEATTSFGPAPPPRDEVASIAVLPFADLSAARDQGYFCEGIAEEILNALARVEGLRVASRSASFFGQSSGTGPAQLAAALGVRHLLEGSVRRALERARITVRLVDAAESSQVWSERFDRDLADIFAVQDEIAETVVRVLTGRLGERERQALGHSARTDLAAYEAYLRGRRSFATALLAGIDEALAEFRAALEIDPGYAPAWAGTADALSWKAIYHGHGEHRGALDEASRRAVELAPELAEARAARANALALLDRPEEAAEEFERALRIGPRSFEARYFHARFLLSRGKLEEGIRELGVAESIRPDDYQAPLLSAARQAAAGDARGALAANERGLALARRRLAIHSGDVRALYLGASALLQLGRRDEGFDWLRRAQELAPDDAVVTYSVACGFAVAGDGERALDALGRAAEKGFAHHQWVANDPDWSPLRDDPRFAAALERMRRK